MSIAWPGKIVFSPLKVCLQFAILQHSAPHGKPHVHHCETSVSALLAVAVCSSGWSQVCTAELVWIRTPCFIAATCPEVWLVLVTSCVIETTFILSFRETLSAAAEIAWFSDCMEVWWFLLWPPLAYQESLILYVFHQSGTFWHRYRADWVEIWDERSYYHPIERVYF